MLSKPELLKRVYLYAALIVQIFAAQIALTEVFGLPAWLCWVAETALVLLGSPLIGAAMAAMAFMTAIELWHLPWWLAVPMTAPAMVLFAVNRVRSRLAARKTDGIINQRWVIPNPLDLLRRSLPGQGRRKPF